MTEKKQGAKLQLHFLANPGRFVRFSKNLFPWLVLVALTFIISALVLGLGVVPEDYRQGDAYRIIFIHVPASWMGLMIYVIIALAAAAGFIWRHPLADLIAKSSAPIGASFTLISLVTGSFWGAPMWGTWWVWDARVTSMLILFFLYLGYIALSNAYDDPTKGARASGILALVGIVNIPIIKFSVDWWNTLHHPATISKFDRPSMDSSMIAPLLLMILGFVAYYLVVLIIRLRAEIADRRIRNLRMIQVDQHNMSA